MKLPTRDDVTAITHYMINGYERAAFFLLAWNDVAKCERSTVMAYPLHLYDAGKYVGSIGMWRLFTDLTENDPELAARIWGIGLICAVSVSPTDSADVNITVPCHTITDLAAGSELRIHVFDRAANMWSASRNRRRHDLGISTRFSAAGTYAAEGNADLAQLLETLATLP